LSVHIYRLVWRQLLFFLHNIAIYLVVIVACGTWRHLGPSVLLAIPALALIVLNAGWVSIVFGILATRYRDIAPILGSVTLVLFLLTPVIWNTDILRRHGGGARVKLVEAIPTYHYLEIVRAPLIGQPLAAYHWYIVLGITAVGWAAALAALRNFRSRVPYWV
jgi:ABC-2 type transport system permease protein